MNNCKDCKWLSFIDISKNHNSSGVDVERYYCIEPEHLENIGYVYLDGRYLYACKRWTNDKHILNKKIKKIKNG